MSDVMNPMMGQQQDPVMEQQVEELQIEGLEDAAHQPEKVSKRESDRLIKRIKDNFQYCADYEAYTRRLNIDDYRFVESDPDNNRQWPSDVTDTIDEDLTLVLNETRQYCLKIINEIKENRPALRARATGGGATKDSAEIFTGLYRYIEYRSTAADAYDLATEHMVKMGIGYWRVVNKYVSNDSFDQDAFIMRIKDPLTVFLDPDIQEPDGSDARYGFIFEDIKRDLAEIRYPQYKKYFGQAALGATGDWLNSERVRIAEYYEKEPTTDVLYSYVVPETGQRATIMASRLPKSIEQTLRADPLTRYRTVESEQVNWYLIIGDRVIKKSVVPCKYVPIVRSVAEENCINGIYDRKGHVRNLKDPQRMLNYWASSAVIHVALQTKTPYVSPIEAIENHQEYWANANKENLPFLPYTSQTKDGKEIPRPQREQPPVMAPAYIQGLEIARQQMMSVAGQYEAVMGQQGPELSGRAIIERKKPGDRSTYHYANALARAIAFTGKIIIDMTPRLYDTERVIRIMGEDQQQSEVRIDPKLQQPSKEIKETVEMEDKVQRVFNPSIGQYDVQASAGPSWGTRREQAAESLLTIMRERPELTSVIGDLFFQSADFPLSEEAAARLKRMVPLQALGDAPPPEVQQLMKTAENLQASLASAIQALANKEEELRNQSQKTQVDSYKAETDRLDTIMEKLELLNPQALAEVVAGLLLAMQQTPLPPPPMPEAPEATALANQAAPGGSGRPGSMPESIQDGLGTYDAIKGIRRNSKGVNYLPDPNNPGQFVEIS